MQKPLILCGFAHISPVLCKKFLQHTFVKLGGIFLPAKWASAGAEPRGLYPFT